MHDTKNILVCISEKTNSLKLIRYANQNFGSKNFKVLVLFVETEDSKQFDEEQRNSLQNNIKKAEEMGFEFYSVTANSISDGILGFINKFDIDITVTGGTKSTRNRSLQNRILEKSNTELLVLKIKTPQKRLNFFGKIPPLGEFKIKNFTVPFVILVVITIIDVILLNTPLAPRLTNYHISMLYILAIVYISIGYGAVFGILSSILSAFTINFFFTYPQYSFGIDNIRDINNHIFFIILASLTSLFGGYSKLREERLRKKEVDNQHILKFANNLTGIARIENLSKHIKRELENILNTEVFIILYNQNTDRLNINGHIRKRLTDEEMVALNLCFSEHTIHGKFSENSVQNSNFTFLPIRTKNESIGVLVINMEDADSIGQYDVRLIHSFADISANAFERAILSERIEQAVKNEDREKLRADLLSAVSHDLKTPLASIIGSLTAMEHMKDSLDEGAIEVLRRTAIEEAERLNQFISNILDMTRIESGGVELNKRLHDPDKIVEKVLKYLRHRTKNHQIEHNKNEKNIKINVDSLMLEQVLQNLIDNAIKYSEKDTKIAISSYEEGDSFIIEVTDEGFGIADEMKEAIFDKFERIKLADKTIAGTGLGLAICKSIMDHMGCMIKVEDNPNSTNLKKTGSVFKLIF